MRNPILIFVVLLSSASVSHFSAAQDAGEREDNPHVFRLVFVFNRKTNWILDRFVSEKNMTRDARHIKASFTYHIAQEAKRHLQQVDRRYTVVPMLDIWDENGDILGDRFNPGDDALFKIWNLVKKFGHLWKRFLLEPIAWHSNLTRHLDKNLIFVAVDGGSVSRYISSFGQICNGGANSVAVGGSNFEVGKNLAKALLNSVGYNSDCVDSNTGCKISTRFNNLTAINERHDKCLNQESKPDLNMWQRIMRPDLFRFSRQDQCYLSNPILFKLANTESPPNDDCSNLACTFKENADDHYTLFHNRTLQAAPLEGSPCALIGHAFDIVYTSAQQFPALHCNAQFQCAA